MEIRKPSFTVPDISNWQIPLRYYKGWTIQFSVLRERFDSPCLCLYNYPSIAELERAMDLAIDRRNGIDYRPLEKQIEIKITPERWQEILGFEIVDPDGWDRSEKFQADWAVPLTFDEFMDKAELSTCARHLPRAALKIVASNFFGE